MLKHRKLVSVIATIAFCLTFLAPAFVAPATVEAASTYTTLTSPTVSIETGPYTGALGKVAIDIPELAALSTGDMFTIGLPSGVEIQSGGVTVDANVILNANRTTPEIGVPFTVTQTTSRNVDVTFNGANIAYGAARIVVNFNNLKITGISGDIEATFSAPGGINGFTSGKALVGKVASVKTVYATISGVKNLSSSGGEIDGITLSEAVPGTFKAGDKVTLTLPNGYSWTGNMVAAGGWGLAGQNSLVGQMTIAPVSGDERKIELTLNSGFASTSAGGQGGRITLGVMVPANPPAIPVEINGMLSIVIDDTVASPGDIVVDVSSNNLDVMPGSLTVATYGAFDVDFLEDSPKDVTAGTREVEVGNIIIKENAPNTLVAKRDIRIDLPTGVKWARANDDTTIFPARTPVKGDTLSWTATNVGTDKQSIKLTIDTASVNNASTYKVSKIKLDISPNFSGDIIAKISGNQGFTGEVKLGTVKSKVNLTVDGTPTNVNIGAQGQALPDIVITENVKEAIRSLDVNGGRAWVTVLLPPSVVFSEVPTVEVTEGNLVIDKAGITKTTSFNGIYRGALNIPITGTSTAPSTIKLSNVKVSVDRTVAEGPLTVALIGLAGHDAFDENIYTGSVAKKGDYFFNYEAVAAVAGAQCITPASQQGRNAVFYIGSTIMSVNGINTIMDAAPYIKAGRTYVPVRYLGDALGADTSWDETTKTVTVTKGDKSVVLVIGSTIAKVNGADVQMDVAPEITGVGRTMLPARWVAEGLGFQVGWNEVLKQVIVQQPLE